MLPLKKTLQSLRIPCPKLINYTFEMIIPMISDLYVFFYNYFIDV